MYNDDDHILYNRHHHHEMFLLFMMIAHYSLPDASGPSHSFPSFFLLICCSPWFSTWILHVLLVVFTWHAKGALKSWWISFSWCCLTWVSVSWLLFWFLIRIHQTSLSLPCFVSSMEMSTGSQEWLEEMMRLFLDLPSSLVACLF